MTRVLNAGRKAPLSGNTRSVVVFLHGYGADFLGLKRGIKSQASFTFGILA